MRCSEAAFGLHDMFQSPQPVLYTHILAASINKHLHVLNSALRTVNPDVGDHNSGSLQMLLVLWSDCHSTFLARPTIQMFVDISHIHFETLSRFQSLDVQFR